MKTRNPKAETFSFFVSRDFLDTEVEVICEIDGYTPPEPAGYYNPPCPAQIELGDTFNLAGEYFPLTELEREAAVESFWAENERRAKTEL